MTMSIKPKTRSDFNQDKPKKGWYTDLTNDEYHASAAISRSNLAKIKSSYVHYECALENPTKPTKAMKLGSTIHDSILSQHEFHLNYVILLDEDSKVKELRLFDRKTLQLRPSSIEIIKLTINKRTKAGREDYEALIKRMAGRTILGASEYVVLKNVHESIKRNKLVHDFLKSGVLEQSFFWEDEKTGKMCKCKPDIINESIEYLADIKTTEISAEEDQYELEIFKREYYIQAAFYLEGINKALGANFQGFNFIVIETVAPYEINVMELDSASIEKGEEVYRGRLDKISDYEENPSKWRGYSQEIKSVSLPHWAWGKDIK
jgi:hypothetical protein